MKKKHKTVDGVSDYELASLKKITIPTFLQVLSAMHFSRLVACPILDQSGLMLVAPSGSLKSQLLMYLNRAYPTSCVCDSNWHYGKLVKMSDGLSNGSIRSLIIPELSSLYAGDPRTGGRMEAALMQMAGEGCVASAEKDTRYEHYEMRVTVYGAMTPSFKRKKDVFWEEGFHRRFLWAHMAMEDPDSLMDYLTAGKQANIDVPPIIEPSEKHIPDLLDYQDKRFVRTLVKDQSAYGPNQTRFMFMCRTAAVLKWHYQRSRFTVDIDWRKTMSDFSACLGKKNALLSIPPEPVTAKFEKEEEIRQLKEASRKVYRKKKSKHKGATNGTAESQEPAKNIEPLEQGVSVAQERIGGGGVAQ